MKDLAFEEIRHRRETNVRMRTHIDSLTRSESDSAHLIEERERTHHPACRRGQEPAHLEFAEIARPRVDHGRACGGHARALRV